MASVPTTPDCLPLGFNSEVFFAAFLRRYFDYQLQTNNLTFPITPIVAANMYTIWPALEN
jgi:hypothetical protein